jgi:hypothetical protein
MMAWQGGVPSGMRWAGMRWLHSLGNLGLNDLQTYTYKREICPSE